MPSSRPILIRLLGAMALALALMALWPFVARAHTPLAAGMLADVVGARPLEGASVRIDALPREDPPGLIRMTLVNERAGVGVHRALNAFGPWRQCAVAAALCAATPLGVGRRVAGIVVGIGAAHVWFAAHTLVSIVAAFSIEPETLPPLLDLRGWRANALAFLHHHLMMGLSNAFAPALLAWAAVMWRPAAWRGRLAGPPRAARSAEEPVHRAPASS